MSKALPTSSRYLVRHKSDDLGDQRDGRGSANKEGLKPAKRAEARATMADQAARLNAFNAIRERLKAARLEREAGAKAKAM